MLYQIRKLSLKFYNDYPHDKYEEILKKQERSYDVVSFELSFIKDSYVCVPFRSEMNHNNGYKFRFSNRSKKHKSGLDFSKLVIISSNEHLGSNATIDNDEFIEFERNVDIIHHQLQNYVLDYINHITGIKRIHPEQFNRKYKFSTLKYFHKELGINTNY